MSSSSQGSRYSFVKLTEKLDRSQFDCGEPSLNDFLKKSARQNQDKNLSVTTAIIEGDKSNRIVGYHTLAIGTIERESLPPQEAKKLPRYPVPIVRIGRLAVDNSAKGHHLGEELLMDALIRCTRVHENVPVFAVVVDALNENAKVFYQKYGFTPFSDKPMSLFLPIETVLQLFSATKAK